MYSLGLLAALSRAERFGSPALRTVMAETTVGHMCFSFVLPQQPLWMMSEQSPSPAALQPAKRLPLDLNSEYPLPSLK